MVGRLIRWLTEIVLHTIKICEFRGAQNRTKSVCAAVTELHTIALYSIVLYTAKEFESGFVNSQNAPKKRTFVRKVDLRTHPQKGKERRL
jgi:hypothetical protein